MTTLSDIKQAIRDAQAGGEGWCATLEARHSPEAWVQWLRGDINASCPASERPALAHFTEVEFQPGQYISGYLAVTTPEEIADWIDDYFRRVLGAPGDYAVGVNLEQME
jgi:hypothetical protein